MSEISGVLDEEISAYFNNLANSVGMTTVGRLVLTRLCKHEKE